MVRATFLFWMLLVIGVESAPLRGSTPKKLQKQPRRRQLMENKGETLAPTIPATSEPTAAPILTPAPVETEAPTQEDLLTPAPVEIEAPTQDEMPTQEDVPTQDDSEPTAGTSVPTSSLPGKAFPLLPFSVEVEGDLGDEFFFRNEIFFRGDLESYLLGTMNVEGLTEVKLEPRSSRRRSLQQTTLLEYQGDAVVEFDDSFESPSTTSVQSAQLEALEEVQDLEDFLAESSTQPLEILQIQVGERDESDDEDASSGTPNQREGKKNNAGKIVGIVVAALVVVGVVALLCFRRRPPPPPPYKLENNSDVDSQDIVITFEDMNTAFEKTMEESEEGSPKKSAKTPMPLSEDTANIDLTQPAQHSEGIDSLVREIYIEENTTNNNDDSTTRQSLDLDSATVESFVSGDGDSMMGYSDGTGDPPSLRIARRPQPPPKTSTSKTGRESPSVQNSAQLRWVEGVAPAKDNAGAQGEMYLSSDSESHIDTEDEIASSYKEDDSVKGGSVMSGSVDFGANAALLTHGALGYFPSPDDDYSESDDAMLPKLTPANDTSYIDSSSDVPYDERNHLSRSREQNLSGFNLLPNFEKASDEVTEPMTSPEKSFVSSGNPDFSPSTMPFSPSPENSFDDENAAEDLRRERRRIKRASRKQREERKQPPVTMEV